MCVCCVHVVIFPWSPLCVLCNILSWWQSDNLLHLGLVHTPGASQSCTLGCSLAFILSHIVWASGLTFQCWSLDWFSSFKLTCSWPVLFVSALVLDLVSEHLIPLLAPCWIFGLCWILPSYTEWRYLPLWISPACGFWLQIIFSVEKKNNCVFDFTVSDLCENNWSHSLCKLVFAF